MMQATTIVVKSEQEGPYTLVPSRLVPAKPRDDAVGRSRVLYLYHRAPARLIRAAQCFLIAHPAHARRPCRFDIVGFHGDGGSDDMQWLRAAFEAH